MYATSKDLWFVAAKRTPFGTYGGALKDFTATDLAVHAAKAALAAGGVAATDVDQVIFGNVQQSSADAIYLARHIGLRSGVPIPAPALTLNRLCGSGFQAVVSAAEQIVLGAATTVLCGGTESMSQAPHVLRGARWGWPLGKAPAISDTLWDALTDSFTGMPMAMTAEELAEQYQLTRAVCLHWARRRAGPRRRRRVALRRSWRQSIWSARRARCALPKTSILDRRRRWRRWPSYRRCSRKTA